MLQPIINHFGHQPYPQILLTPAHNGISPDLRPLRPIEEHKEFPQTLSQFKTIHIGTVIAAHI